MYLQLSENEKESIRNSLKFGQKINAQGFILVLVLLFLSSTCRCPHQETVVVDFTNPRDEEPVEEAGEGTHILRVAIATVISPRESFVYYKDLFDYMAEQLKLEIEFKQRMTYEEVNGLLAENQVDVAFVCSGAYVVGSEHMELLVVPLHNGLPYYQGYLLTRQNSEIKQFSDFQEKSFPYSAHLCFTGKLFVDGKLADMGTTADDFFGSVVYSSSHDISIQMVSRGLVDGASVNGLIYDYLSVFSPQHLDNIKVIEKSNYFGIPPIVHSKSLAEPLKTDIRNFLMEMHLSDRGRQILNHLQIDQFILTGDTLYDGIRKARNRLMQ